MSQAIESLFSLSERFGARMEIHPDRSLALYRGGRAIAFRLDANLTAQDIIPRLERSLLIDERRHG